MKLAKPETPSENLQRQEDIISTAQWLYDRKEYAMVRPMLEKFIDTGKNQPTLRSKALLMLANIAQDNKDTPRTLVLLHTWLDNFQAYPEAPRVAFTLGKLYRDLHSYTRAQEYFYRSLSNLLARTSATSDDKQVKQNAGLSVLVKWEIAETEYRMNDWNRALELFQRFVDQDPDSKVLVQSAEYREGDCYYFTGANEEAIQTYLKALSDNKLHPFAPEALLRLVDLYGKQDNSIKQIAALKALVWLVEQAHPDDIGYWQQRTARVLMSSLIDKPDKAQQMLSLIKSDPNNLDPNNKTNWLQFAEFLQAIVDRKDPKAVDALLSKNDSKWSDWKKEIDNNYDQLAQRIDALEY
jgi:tetratricopeptide (TPR) repeat protein